MPLTDPLTAQALNFRVFYDPQVTTTETEIITNYKVSQCSAAAIAPRLLLTAAHCISSRTDAEHRLEVKNALGEPIVLKSVKSVRHPEYLKGNKQYDLAVVLLESEVPGELVQILKMPAKEKSLDLKTVTAAGYGRMDGRPGYPGNLGTLRTAALTVTSYSVQSPVFHVDHSKGKGFCQGDSGGPALTEIDGAMNVVGVASKTFFDNTLPKDQWDLCNKAGEYINVQFHQDWIVSTGNELMTEP